MTARPRPTMKEVTLEGGIVADVCDDGSQDWVVLLHSRYTNKRLWAPIAAHISRGSAIAFNQRGFNPGDAAAPSPEGLLESLESVIASIKPRRVLLVGTSTGAGIALAACTDTRLPIVGAILAGFLVPSLGNAGVATRYESGSVTDRTFTPDFIRSEPERVKQFQELSEEVRTAAAAFSIDNFWRFLVRFPYHSIRVPLLFITGASDNLMPPDIVRESLRRLPTAESVVIPEVGHGVVAQAPELVLPQIERMLDRLGWGEGERG